jgi:hypothetical protein
MAIVEPQAKHSAAYDVLIVVQTPRFPGTQIAAKTTEASGSMVAIVGR